MNGLIPRRIIVQSGMILMRILGKIYQDFHIKTNITTTLFSISMRISFISEELATVTLAQAAE